MSQSKAAAAAMSTAIGHAVRLRRSIVDCRLDRTNESALLEKATKILTDLESIQTTLAGPIVLDNPEVIADLKEDSHPA